MEERVNKKVRMQEVAERSGVSTPTVSRILSGRQNVSPELTKRVMRIASEMGYRKLRNRSPRPLTSRLGDGINRMRTGNIAFLMCESDVKQANMVMTRCHEMLSQAHSLLKEYGLNVMLASDNSVTAKNLPDIIRDDHIDGAIVANYFRREFLEKLVAAVPVVMLNKLSYLPPIPCVVIDHNLMLLKAFDHLIKLGHKRIAYFGAEFNGPELQNPVNFHSRGRLEAYREAAYYFNMEEYLLQEKFGMNGHFEAVKNAFDKLEAMSAPPTAIITGALYGSCFAFEASKRGIRVPEDLSILATDDPVVAGIPAPQLTAFKSNMEVVVAVELLVKKLKGEFVPNQKVLIEPELIVRESTGPIKS